MEVRVLKHVRPITGEKPVAAALWQEIFCQLNEAILIMLEFKGGSLPIVNFISNKCDLPGGDDGV